MATLFELTKLSAAPAEDAVAPENHHFVKLTFKTNKEGVKKPDSWYVVPDIQAQFIVAANEGDEKVLAMMYSLLEDAQRERLYEFDAGELAAKDWVMDVRKLAERYFIDGRSLGVKQEQLEEWIDNELRNCLVTRINRSMAAVEQQKRDSLVKALIEQFKIAATRNNFIKGKFLTEVTLKDLAGRLAKYSEEEDLVICNEFDAMKGRIEKHLKPTVKVATDVVEEF